MENQTILFQEEQQFRQPWLWWLVAPMAVLVIGLFLWGMIEQLVFGRPWGDHPMSDVALAIVGPAIILFEMGMVWLLYTARLVTQVRPDGVYVRFFPFHRSFVRVGAEEIVSCEARTYSPIGEYGGWGIRYGRNGKAYNVSGDQGVQLELASGRSLLIGSQQAEALAAAIRGILAPA